MAINPNSDRDFIENVDITNPHHYPKFFSSVRFDIFRHIKNLKVEFKSPITVITGSNKVGKTTILQAIACSHYNFNKRDVVNGNFKRVKGGM